MRSHDRREKRGKLGEATRPEGTTLICPKCGENNPENFRFCGMCGTVLATPNPATAPHREPLLARDGPVAQRIPANPPRPAGERNSLHAGPSLAGLGQPSSREKGLFGTEPRFEIEEPKGGLGRRLVVILLLAMVGVWAYYHYAGSGGGSARPQPAAAEKTSDSGDTLAEKTPPGQVKPVPSASPEAPAPAPAQVVPETPADTAAKHPEGKIAAQRPSAASAKSKRPGKTTVATAKQAAKVSKDSPLHKVRAGSAVAAKPAPAADAGEAERRKGEAYLYGRGAAKNCDAAIKYLKAASAKDNAKARSTFGTMYATGHCVPRDLPTSYSWFALALRADPNNQVLEKDLSAIWNQMTPPERLLATKKQ